MYVNKKKKNVNDNTQKNNKGIVYYVGYILNCNGKNKIYNVHKNKFL